MKVDKGVCTSNDAYFAGNTTASELSSIIKFETVFTTLVENKILAIKRDCELHEAKKKEKSRPFRGILSKKTDADENQQQQPAEVGVEAKKKSRKNFFLRHKNKQCEVDVEKGEKRDNGGALEVPPEVTKVELENDKEANAPVDSQSNEVEAAPGGDRSPPNCDTLIVNSQAENAQLTLASTKDSSNLHSSKTIKETSPPSASNAHTDESLATTIDISLQSSVVKAAPIDSAQIVHEKSDVAICDDGASSQNTSDIEFSLVSESISELPSGVRKKSPNNSDPVKKKAALFLSPPLTREVKVSERKAISCQSTPLFGRHQAKGEGEVKKVLTFQMELPKKVSDTKPAEKAKSQTIVIAPTSTTTTTTLAKAIPSASGPLENVHTSRKSQRHSKYRDVSVEYEISYDDNDGNQSPRGFISSFNQLTSQAPPAAVITTSSKKQASSSLVKSQSLKDGRAQQEAAVDGKSDDKTAKHPDVELELEDLAVDVVNKKKRRRSKQRRVSLKGALQDFRTFAFLVPFQGRAVDVQTMPLFIHLQVVLSTAFSAGHPISQCKSLFVPARTQSEQIWWAVPCFQHEKLRIRGSKVFNLKKSADVGVSTMDAVLADSADEIVRLEELKQ